MLLKSARVTYFVKYAFKMVQGSSLDLKCDISWQSGDDFEYLMKIPVKSFVSGDSTLDEHMHKVMDVEHFPIVKGKTIVSKHIFNKKNNCITVNIEVHGVSKDYFITLDDYGKKASFALDLEAHKIERPSLFMIKINNEVPIKLELQWELSHE